MEEVKYKLSVAKVFTRLDTSSGYWQLVLEEDSSKLTTVIRHLNDIGFGVYHLVYVAQVKSFNAR